MDPKETLEHLKSITGGRVHRSLEAVYDVCQELLDRGECNFSYENVARAGDGRGVPRAQSLRNKTGEIYRILIGSFSAISQTKKGPKNSVSESSWIQDIDDAKLRFLVMRQASELLEANRLIREIVPPGTEIYIDDRGGLRPDFRLDSSERRALEYLLSEEFLRAFGFHAGKYGDVIDSTGNKVFKPGTLGALKKSLLYL